MGNLPDSFRSQGERRGDLGRRRPLGKLTQRERSHDDTSLLDTALRYLINRRKILLLTLIGTGRRAMPYSMDQNVQT